MTSTSPLPPLFRHQEEAQARLLAGSFMLWHEQGLGKTRTILTAWQRLNAAGPPRRMLVVCPAIAKNVWRHEALLLDIPLEEILVLEGRKTPKAAALEDGHQPANIIPQDIRLVIINYDILDAWFQHLQHWAQDAILTLDEAHYLRNGQLGGSIQRTRPLRPLVWRAERVWQATGTYMANSAMDVFYQASFLGPASPFMGWSTTQFGKKFCEPDYNAFARKGRGDWSYKGVKSEPALMAAVAKVSERRLKHDCLDLPAKIRNAQWVDRLAKKQEIRGTDAGLALARARADLSLRKAKLTIEYVKAAIVDRPLIVFGYHHEFLNKVSAEFDAPIISGETPNPVRARLVEQYQAGRIPVLVAQLQAAGVAITLTRGAHAVFGEVHWSAIDHRQAEDRLHRPGQERDVTYHYLLVENSVDELVWDTVLAKGTAIDRLDAAMSPAQAARKWK